MKNLDLEECLSDADGGIMVQRTIILHIASAQGGPDALRRLIFRRTKFM
jgi:hypothetical protein